MGDLWRSQPMQLVQMFINIEAAHDTLDELGEEGLVQFKDLNPNVNAFQRHFFREVKRYEEIERKLRFFHTQIKLFNEVLVDEGREIIDIAPTKPVGGYALDNLELKFEQIEKEMQYMNSNQSILTRNRNELIEWRYTLMNEEKFFSTSSILDSSNSDSALHLAAPDSDYSVNMNVKNVELGFITGVIDKDKFPVFQPILFRATRGNLYLNKAEITEKIRDLVTSQGVHKVAYIVFFQGEVLENKIKKISESFGAHLYTCPDTPLKRSQLLAQVEERLSDLNTVLCRSLDYRASVLGEISTNINSWFERVHKEKAIYHTMNMFNYDVGRKCLVAEGWVPCRSLEKVSFALSRARDRSGALVPSILTPIETQEDPPTHFETNCLTVGFQNIIDAFGIPRYREINPTVFTIVTFPFLFGIMFGDVGHGLALLFFSLFMIYKEKEWSKRELNQLIEIPFAGRYVLLLLSFFSIYCGFIYNEFFSVPMAILPTNWQINPGQPTHYIPISLNRTYEFGIDWMWKGSKNELAYYNSLKMKLSVIVGIIQMSLGLVLKGLNARYFKKKLDLFCECIPQIITLVGLFGYICALIFLKWLYPFYANDVNGKTQDPSVAGINDAPMLLTMIIYMFLPPGSEPPARNPTHTGPYWSFYTGQSIVQLVLIILAVISIFVMLLAKPLILYFQNSRRMGKSDLEAHLTNSHHEEFDFADIMVHQAIETIEFSLSTVSNTASYLRLWALSLAHSELATVFWNIGLVQMGLSQNFIMTFIVWMVFVGISTFVLMTLETLSAFLHTMRLHWVEFQNKFYKGDGYLFKPFSYSSLNLTLN